MTYAPPGYPAPPRTSGKATAALVVAIVGLFICAPVAGVVALVLAGQAASEIRASGGQLTGEGNVTAARVIAAIDIALGALVVLAILAITFLGNTASDKLDDEGRTIPRIVVPAR